MDCVADIGESQLHYMKLVLCLHLQVREGDCFKRCLTHSHSKGLPHSQKLHVCSNTHVCQPWRSEEWSNPGCSCVYAWRACAKNNFGGELEQDLQWLWGRIRYLRWSITSTTREVRYGIWGQIWYLRSDMVFEGTGRLANILLCSGLGTELLIVDIGDNTMIHITCTVQYLH